jgi:hypothetical protein
MFSTASQASADQVKIVNRTGSTIYRLYAWPTDLIARSFNVLNGQLQDNSTTTVNVDNSYQDCSFTFQYDLNNPADKKKRGYRRKVLINMEINLCASKDVALLTTNLR